MSVDADDAGQDAVEAVVALAKLAKAFASGSSSCTNPSSIENRSI